MPLDRLVLILVIVIAAAGATIWVAATLIASAALPVGWLALVPILPVAYIGWRVVADRLGNREDDYYDRMK